MRGAKFNEKWMQTHVNTYDFTVFYYSSGENKGVRNKTIFPRDPAATRGSVNVKRRALCMNEGMYRYTDEGPLRNSMISATRPKEQPTGKISVSSPMFRLSPQGTAAALPF